MADDRQPNRVLKQDKWFWVCLELFKVHIFMVQVHTCTGATYLLSPMVIFFSQML